MKLIVFSPYYPPHVGGLESHAAEFDDALSQHGHTVLTLTPHLPATAPATEHTDNHIILRYPAWELIVGYPLPQLWHPQFWRMLGQAKAHIERNATVVISRTRFFFSSLMAGIFAWWHQVPWLHIEHGSDYTTLGNAFTTWLARWYDHTIGRALLRRATIVVSNSKATQGFVHALSGRSSTVIYRGIHVHANEPPRSKSTKAEPLHIVYVGRLVAGKGVHHLLEALADMTAPFVATLIGDGPEMNALRSQSQQLGIADRVTFLGQRSRAEAFEHMRNSDVLVNPSYNEGLPTSVIEGVRAGCTIVATDVGGTKEVVSPDAALLIPPRSSKALADALNRLAQNPSLHERLRERAQGALPDFSWQRAVRQYEHVLEAMLSP